MVLQLYRTPDYGHNHLTAVGLTGKPLSPVRSAIAGGDCYRSTRPVDVCVSVALRILDDGAWLSVNDTRRVSVSELWRLDAPEFCECDLVDFIAEGFTSVSADGRDVAVTTYGQCIVCGESGVPGKLPVGRIRSGEYRGYDRENIVMQPIERRKRENQQ